MSRHVFYCRCGARLEGSSAHLYHRCPPVAASGDLPDEQAATDPDVLDLETVCAWCGREHGYESTRSGHQDCPCKRHIDGGEGKHACNAAAPEIAQTPPLGGLEQ